MRKTAEEHSWERTIRRYDNEIYSKLKV
jgi:hypothetical protein